MTVARLRFTFPEHPAVVAVKHGKSPARSAAVAVQIPHLLTIKHMRFSGGDYIITLHAYMPPVQRLLLAAAPAQKPGQHILIIYIPNRSARQLELTQCLARCRIEPVHRAFIAQVHAVGKRYKRTAHPHRTCLVRRGIERAADALELPLPKLASAVNAARRYVVGSQEHLPAACHLRAGPGA